MTANTNNYDYYDYDARLEDEIERAEDASILFAKISIAFAIFALFANCAHLFFLINKELRKLSVFVIMLSLCISDIFSLCVALISFIYKLVPLSRDGYCEPFVSLLETQITRALSAIGTAALSTSLWLTILMAAFRSLSSLFVMSKLKGILAKVSTAIAVIVVIVMYSILSSAFQFYGIYRIQIRNDSDSCVPTGSVNFTYRKQFKCAVLPDQFEWSRKFDYVSTAATYIQTLLYTIFTVILVVSVKKTKKESKIVNRLETTRKDNTTKMVLAMLIAFLITKVWEYMSTAIFLSLPESYIKIQLRDYVNNISLLLAIVHSSTHFFICFFISTVYRNVVKGEWVKLTKKNSMFQKVERRSSTRNTSLVKFASSTSSSLHF